jgi:hypothetical protein
MFPETNFSRIWQLLSETGVSLAFLSRTIALRHIEEVSMRPPVIFLHWWRCAWRVETPVPRICGITCRYRRTCSRSEVTVMEMRTGSARIPRTIIRGQNLPASSSLPPRMEGGSARVSVAIVRMASRKGSLSRSPPQQKSFCDHGSYTSRLRLEEAFGRRRDMVCRSSR